MKKVFSFIIGLIGFLIVISAILLGLDFFGIYKLPNEFFLKDLLKNDKYTITISASEGELEKVSNDSTKKKKIEVVQKEESELTQEEIDEMFRQIDYESNQKKEEYNKSLDENNENGNNTSRFIGYSENSFYYNQLDQYGKRIYTELYNHKDDLKDGLYTIDFDLEFNDLLNEENGIEKLNNSYQLAINALTFDNPEIFYIDITKVYLLTETTSYFTGKKEYRVKIGSNDGLRYYAESFNSQEEIDDAIYSMDLVRESALDLSSREESVEGKIRILHNFIVNNVDYDNTLSKPNIYNIYGALKNHEAVCEGYARAFKFLLDAINIPCIIVTGIGINNNGDQESHAWNYVQIDGNWYAVDATWDDPIIVGGGEATKEMTYKYFLKGREIESNHYQDGYIVGDTFSFKYPTLSERNYEN